MTTPFLVPRFVPSESTVWAYAPDGGLTLAQFEAVRALVAAPDFAHMVGPDWTGEERRRGPVAIVVRLTSGRLRAYRVGAAGRVLQTVEA